MRLVVVHFVGGDIVLDPDAFDSQIGSTIRINTPSGSVLGTIVAANASPDRHSVELTIEGDLPELEPPVRSSASADST